MSIYYEDESVVLHHGDCLEVLATLPDSSVDAVCTDPPYGLANTDPAHVAETITRWVNGERDYLPGGTGFMGKAWDAFVPPVAVWDECLRVLKPGGHVLAFAGTRTVDLMTLGLRLAGFDIRDSIAWLYGSGFPKSLDVSKAIDKRAEVNEETKRRVALVAEVIRTHREAAGMERAEVSRAVVGTPSGACWNWEHQQLPSVEMWPAIKRTLSIPDKFDGLIEGDRAQFIAAEREVIGTRTTGIGTGRGSVAYIADSDNRDITAPATPAAERWQGWGTALKPSHEPVVCAMKPLDNAALFARIGSQLEALEEACRRRASGAARSSAPTRPASPEARTATAPERAVTPHEGEPERLTGTGAAAGSSAPTATSASAWTAETFLSTVTSWKACLAEISEATSMSTTSTATRATTDLTTLSSCLSSIMQSVTAQSIPDPRSWSSLATAADNLFAAGVLSSRSTHALSATESATESTPPSHQGAGGSSAAFEPVVVARKPLSGTVAQTVLEHGTGALNIDGCRIEGAFTSGWSKSGSKASENDSMSGPNYARDPKPDNPAGRWPANVVLDESQAEVLDEQSGEFSGQVGMRATTPVQFGVGHEREQQAFERGVKDFGGASRYFPTFRYEAKAPKSERPKVNGTAHPTVKPLDLMRWLVRLITPPGGTVLEPFAGSGTTVEACVIEGFRCIAIEKTDEYLPLTVARIHRRRDPVAAIKLAGDDLGLFDLGEETA